MVHTAIVGLVGLISLSGCSSVPAAGPTAPAGRDYFSTLDDQREVTRCLQDRGWDVDLDESQSAIVLNVPPEQEDEIDEDVADCQSRTNVVSADELTDDDFDFAYEWYSDAASCLADHGWTVPPKPSRQTFQASYASDPWVPWSGIPLTEIAQAMTECPMMTGRS